MSNLLKRKISQKGGKPRTSKSRLQKSRQRSQKGGKPRTSKSRLQKSRQRSQKGGKPRTSKSRLQRARQRSQKGEKPRTSKSRLQRARQRSQKGGKPRTSKSRLQRARQRSQKGGKPRMSKSRSLKSRQRSQKGGKPRTSSQKGGEPILDLLVLLNKGRRKIQDTVGITAARSQIGNLREEYNNHKSRVACVDAKVRASWGCCSIGKCGAPCSKKECTCADCVEDDERCSISVGTGTCPLPYSKQMEKVGEALTGTKNKYCFSHWKSLGLWKIVAPAVEAYGHPYAHVDPIEQLRADADKGGLDAERGKRAAEAVEQLRARAAAEGSVVVE